MLKNCTDTSSRYLPTQLSCNFNDNCTQKDYEWLDLFMSYAMEDLEDFLRKHYRISLTNRWNLDRDLERFLKNTNL